MIDTSDWSSRSSIGFRCELRSPTVSPGLFLIFSVRKWKWRGVQALWGMMLKLEMTG